MSARWLLMLGAGFTIWASAFVALYAMLSVGCAFGWHHVEVLAGVTLQRAQLVVILLVHLAAGMALIVMLRNVHGPFLVRASYLAAIAALGSSIFSFAAVFGLSACNP